MEQAHRPRHGDEDLPPANPTVAEANDLNAGEHIVVETDYRARSADPEAKSTTAVDAGEPIRTSADVAPIDRLRDWVGSDPPVALGSALGLGLAIGFVLRRTVLLSPWELLEVKHG